jgi:flagellin-like protein
MKGISAVIGALIVLIITVALGGIAYTYITGTATQRISVVLEVDPSTTTCNGATDAITIGVLNSGTSPITFSSLKISGTTSTGSTIAETFCNSTIAGGSTQISAGGRGTCTSTVTGANGNNNIVVAGGGSSTSGIVFCA